MSWSNVKAALQFWNPGDPWPTNPGNNPAFFPASPPAGLVSFPKRDPKSDDQAV